MMEDTKSQDYTGLDKKKITSQDVDYLNNVYEDIYDKNKDRNKSKPGVPVWVTVVSCFVVGLLASIVTAVICLLAVAPSMGHDEVLTTTPDNLTAAIVDEGLRNEDKDNGSESVWQTKTGFTLEVWSEGAAENGPYDWEEPLFYINGHAILGAPRARGWNIVVLDRMDLHVISAKNFDTYSAPTSDVTLRDYLTEVPFNSIVLGAIWDTACRYVPVRQSTYFSELVLLLAPYPFKLSDIIYRDAYAFIGFKGYECEERPSWVTDYRNTYAGSSVQFATSPVHVTAHIPPLSCPTK